MEIEAGIYYGILSVVVTGLFNLLLFYLRSRKNASLRKASINGKKATTIESLQRSLDSLSNQYAELQEANLLRDERITELQQLLAREIEKRKALEKSNLEYIKGIALLIEQLEKLQIVPVWKPVSSEV